LGIFLVQQFMERVVYCRENEKNILTMIYKKK
jgi:anti-sigma regulatory factor (Ser/Thr protein kinase)